MGGRVWNEEIIERPAKEGKEGKRTVESPYLIGCLLSIYSLADLYK